VGGGEGGGDAIHVEIVEYVKRKRERREMLYMK